MLYDGIIIRFGLMKQQKRSRSYITKKKKTELLQRIHDNIIKYNDYFLSHESKLINSLKIIGNDPYYIVYAHKAGSLDAVIHDVLSSQLEFVYSYASCFINTMNNIPHIKATLLQLIQYNIQSYQYWEFQIKNSLNNPKTLLNKSNFNNDMIVYFKTYIEQYNKLIARKKMIYHSNCRHFYMDKSQDITCLSIEKYAGAKEQEKQKKQQQVKEESSMIYLLTLGEIYLKGKNQTIFIDNLIQTVRLKCSKKYTILSIHFKTFLDVLISL